jgi:hypothetical protein
MFNKLLIKALGKHFNKLSPEEKQNVREMVNNETISETTEKQKVKKRRKKTMADEKEVKTNEVETSKVETENNEVDKGKSTDVVDTKEEKVEETDKKEEPTAPTEEETAKDEEPTAPQVEETEPQGNGIDINDLVTKDMLAQRLSALEAKFDAVVKENSDLKNQLSNKNDELNGMKDKYENIKDYQMEHWTKKNNKNMLIK